MSDVRCFRHRDESPAGIWVMTRPTGWRGAFFHGNRWEIQAPRYSVAELATGRVGLGTGFLVEEITPAQVLEELANWPKGQRYVEQIFERHGVLAEDVTPKPMRPRRTPEELDAIVEHVRRHP